MRGQRPTSMPPCVPQRWTCAIGAWVQLAGAPQIREKKRLLRNWQRANPATTVNLGDRPGWASLKCFRASRSAASRLGRSRSAWKRHVRQSQANGEAETSGLIVPRQGQDTSPSHAPSRRPPFSGRRALDRPSQTATHFQVPRRNSADETIAIVQRQFEARCRSNAWSPPDVLFAPAASLTFGRRRP
jgi:hypothetical protein